MSEEGEKPKQHPPASAASDGADFGIPSWQLRRLVRELREEQRRVLELAEWLAVAIGQRRIALAAPSRISP